MLFKRTNKRVITNLYEMHARTFIFSKVVKKKVKFLTKIAKVIERNTRRVMVENLGGGVERPTFHHFYAGRPAG